MIGNAKIDKFSCAVLKSLSICFKIPNEGVLELPEERGNTLRMPYSEHLDDGIFQLRIQVGNNITRILYFFIVDCKIIVTNGFANKT